MRRASAKSRRRSQRNRAVRGSTRYRSRNNHGGVPDDDARPVALGLAATGAGRLRDHARRCRPTDVAALSSRRADRARHGRRSQPLTARRRRAWNSDLCRGGRAPSWRGWAIRRGAGRQAAAISPTVGFTPRSTRPGRRGARRSRSASAAAASAAGAAAASGWAAASASRSAAAAARTIVVTELAVQIKRRGDQSPIWEGRAQTERRRAPGDADARHRRGKLAAALFTGLPRRVGAHYHGEMTHPSPSTPPSTAATSASSRIDGDTRRPGDRRRPSVRFLPMVLTSAWPARAGGTLTFRILNAGGSAYPFGWPGYRRARQHRPRGVAAWSRRSYADGVLRFDMDGATADLVWFAYFAPYSMEQHHDLVARIAAHARRDASRAGHDARRAGDRLLRRSARARSRSGSTRASIPARSMAEWWMEGALEWLTDATRPRRCCAAGDVPRRAQHEPRRHAARASAHQRRGREPQPRMARADARAQPRSAVRARRDGRDRRRFRDGRARRRGDPGELPRRLRGHPELDRRARREILRVRPAAGGAHARFPDRAGLSEVGAGQGQSVDVDQPARRALRRGVDDAGDAVQGPRSRTPMPSSAGRPSGRSGWRSRAWRRWPG